MAATHDRFERKIVRYINAERARNGLARLVANRRLAGAASGHSADQLRAGRLSHNGSNGTPFATRVHHVMRAHKMGETVGFLPRRARGGAMSIVRMWLNSPPHRAQLLDPSFRRIGVGRKNGKLAGRRGVVVTADFATSR